MDSRRDVVVIGASLGGLNALTRLVSTLPPDLPATVLIVQHVSQQSPGLLSEILDRRGPLRVHPATDRTQALPGNIYVAPPDRHLLLTEQGMRVVFGPRENRSRPAIDPLFRTAAVHYRSRVIGLILTGLQDDGAAGLRAVAACGGVPLVQAPSEAAQPEMPLAALSAVENAREVLLDEIGPLLSRLTREPAPAPPPVPEALRLEARLTERAMKTPDWTDLPGRPVDFTCPDCGGGLREIDGEGTVRYRCRVGHAFSAQVLAAAKDESVEEALWVALQTLQERAQMLFGMARSDQDRGWHRSAASLEERAREARVHADKVRAFILQIGS